MDYFARRTLKGNEYTLEPTGTNLVWDVISNGKKITTINLMMNHEAVDKYIDEILTNEGEIK